MFHSITFTSKETGLQVRAEGTHETERKAVHYAKKLATRLPKDLFVAGSLRPYQTYANPLNDEWVRQRLVLPKGAGKAGAYFGPRWKQVPCTAQAVTMVGGFEIARRDLGWRIEAWQKVLRKAPRWKRSRNKSGRAQ